jgi:asparagine synthase (glutamine-hydrolysing)
LRAALRDSVQHHLIADVPVGIFLSSGLDSTTLLALASEAEPSSLHTITLGFREYQGTENDETILAELIARRYGAVHQTIWVEKEDFSNDLTRLLQAMDQPSIDGVNTYFVSKVASEAGMKVALSGLGGDELFGGYPSFQDIPRMVNMLSFAKMVPAIGETFRIISAPILKHFTSPKYAGLLEYGSTYSGAYLLRRGLFMPWELTDIMDADAVKEGWKELQPLVRLEETIQGLTNQHLIVSALEVAWYMRNQLLRDADWAGMAHSLEIRVPLVDIELLRNIAPLLAMKHMPTKTVMAQSLNKQLPGKVLQRRKTGFSVPVRDWLIQKQTSGAAERGLRGWARRVYNVNGCNT